MKNLLAYSALLLWSMHADAHTETPNEGIKRWMEIGKESSNEMENKGVVARAADGAGNGGIDVINPEGRSVPFESFVELNSDWIENVCDLANSFNSKVSENWPKHLQAVVDHLHHKLPRAAEILVQGMTEDSLFYFIDLPDGYELRFTNDHSGVIANKWLRNGTVRIGKRVYISRKAWNDFYVVAPSDFKFTHMLTRVVHEALIPYYALEDKYQLGLAVVEILRLAGFFPSKAPRRMDQMSSLEAAEFLDFYGLTIGKQRYSRGLLNSITGGFPVIDTFAIAFDTGLNELEDETHRQTIVNLDENVRRRFEHKIDTISFIDFFSGRYFYYGLDDLNQLPEEILASADHRLNLQNVKSRLANPPQVCE